MTSSISEVARAAGTEPPARPRLAPWLSVVDLGDGRVDFRAAGFSYALRHPLLAAVYRAISHLLDGRHGVEEITAAGGEGVLPTTVLFLLGLLTTNGCLQEGAPPTPLPAEAQARFADQLLLLSRFVSDPARVLGMLASARVGLYGSEPLADLVAAELGNLGVGEISRVPTGTPGGASAILESGASLTLVCLESPGFGVLEEINSAALATGVRWLPAVLTGPACRLGPCIVPHHSACHHCFELRWRSQEDEPDRFVAYRELSEHPGEGALGAQRSLLAAQVALEALRLLTGFTPPTTIGRFYEFDLFSPLATAHDVLKVPRCPKCGRSSPAREAWARGVEPPETP